MLVARGRWQRTFFDPLQGLKKAIGYFSTVLERNLNCFGSYGGLVQATPDNRGNLIISDRGATSVALRCMVAVFERAAGSFRQKTISCHRVAAVLGLLDYCACRSADVRHGCVLPQAEEGLSV